METLFAASGDRILALMSATTRTSRPTGRAPSGSPGSPGNAPANWRSCAPAARAAVLREPFSAQLRRNRGNQLARLRTEVVEIFAAEIAAAGPAGQTLTDALVACASFGLWTVLRDQLGLTESASVEALSRTLTGLLTTAGAGLPDGA